MIEAFYSGTAGLKAHQTAVDVIANNMANVNTTGYKSKRAEFEGILRSSMVNPAEANSNNLLAGSGSAVGVIKTDMSGGVLQNTGVATDFAITGDGYFAVEDQNGNRFYTSDGHFQIMNTPQGTFLGNSSGMYVLDSAGNRISATTSKISNTPGVYTFNNSSALTSTGGNMFQASAYSGGAQATNIVPVSGELLESNVSLADQMTALITAQRGYQYNSSVVSTASQIETMVNELGRS